MNKEFDAKAAFLMQMEEALRRQLPPKLFDDPKASFLNKAEQVHREFALSGMSEVLGDMYGVSGTDMEKIVDAITPPILVRLRKAGDLYEAEYEKAKKTDSYFNACVMAAAALESVLLMIAYANEDSEAVTAAVSSRRYQNGRPSVLKLSFDELVGLMYSEGWLSEKLALPFWTQFTTQHRKLFLRLSEKDDLPKASCHLLVRFLQVVRNYIHPSRFADSTVNANDADLTKAFQIAAASYPDLRNILLLRLSKDAHLLQNRMRKISVRKGN